jgi:hypothetical protein
MLLLLVFNSPGIGVPASALEYKFHVLYMLQVKSSYYSPQSKEQNPQQAEQGHANIQQCV